MERELCGSSGSLGGSCSVPRTVAAQELIVLVGAPSTGKSHNVAALLQHAHQGGGWDTRNSPTPVAQKGRREPGDAPVVVSASSTANYTSHHRAMAVLRFLERGRSVILDLSNGSRGSRNSLLCAVAKDMPHVRRRILYCTAEPRAVQWMRGCGAADALTDFTRRKLQGEEACGSTDTAPSTVECSSSVTIEAPDVAVDMADVIDHRFTSLAALRAQLVAAGHRTRCLFIPLEAALDTHLHISRFVLTLVARWAAHVGHTVLLPQGGHSVADAAGTAAAGSAPFLSKIVGAACVVFVPTTAASCVAAATARALMKVFEESPLRLPSGLPPAFVFRADIPTATGVAAFHDPGSNTPSALSLVHLAFLVRFFAIDLSRSVLAVPPRWSASPGDMAQLFETCALAGLRVCDLSKPTGDIADHVATSTLMRLGRSGGRGDGGGETWPAAAATASAPIALCPLAHLCEALPGVNEALLRTQAGAAVNATWQCALSSSESVWVARLGPEPPLPPATAHGAEGPGRRKRRQLRLRSDDQCVGHEGIGGVGGDDDDDDEGASPILMPPGGDTQRPPTDASPPLPPLSPSPPAPLPQASPYDRGFFPLLRGAVPLVLTLAVVQRTFPESELGVGQQYVAQGLLPPSALFGVVHEGSLCCVEAKCLRSDRGASHLIHLVVFCDTVILARCTCGTKTVVGGHNLCRHAAAAALLLSQTHVNKLAKAMHDDRPVLPLREEGSDQSEGSGRAAPDARLSIDGTAAPSANRLRERGNPGDDANPITTAKYVPTPAVLSSSGLPLNLAGPIGSKRRAAVKARPGRQRGRVGGGVTEGAAASKRTVGALQHAAVNNVDTRCGDDGGTYSPPPSPIPSLLPADSGFEEWDALLGLDGELPAAAAAVGARGCDTATPSHARGAGAAAPPQQQQQQQHCHRPPVRLGSRSARPPPPLGAQSTTAMSEVTREGLSPQQSRQFGRAASSPAAVSEIDDELPARTSMRRDGPK